jgi:hypothetical protein
MHTLFHGKTIGKTGHWEVALGWKNRRTVLGTVRSNTNSAGMSHATRRRTANVPAASSIATPITAATLNLFAHPSGRFDALVDMGNPMKGINLFPYLRRRVEGRALVALGPATVLELSRTVREAALPRRWPREVFDVFSSFYALCLIICSLFFSTPIMSVARRVAARRWIAGQSIRPIQRPA